jgi:hypothetical protein
MKKFNYLLTAMLFISSLQVSAQNSNSNLTPVQVLGSYSFGNGHITSFATNSGECLRKSTVHEFNLFVPGETVYLKLNEYNSLYSVEKDGQDLGVFTTISCLDGSSSESNSPDDLILPNDTEYTFEYDPITGEPLTLYYSLPVGWNVYFGDDIASQASAGSVKCDCVAKGDLTNTNVAGACVPHVGSNGPTCGPSNSPCSGTCLRTFGVVAPTLDDPILVIDVDFLMIRAGVNLDNIDEINLNDYCSTGFGSIVSYQEWLDLPFISQENLDINGDLLDSFNELINGMTSSLDQTKIVAVAFKLNNEKFLMDIPFSLVSESNLYTLAAASTVYSCSGSCTAGTCTLITSPSIACTTCDGCKLSWTNASVTK